MSKEASAGAVCSEPRGTQRVTIHDPSLPAPPQTAVTGGDDGASADDGAGGGPGDGAGAGDNNDDGGDGEVFKSTPSVQMMEDTRETGYNMTQDDQWGDR